MRVLRDAAADCVLLTKPEAVRIAALLHAARTHLPSPRAADEAVALLTQSSRSTW